VLSSFWKEKYILESKKNWDLFYKRNGIRFFRDRYWTLNETGQDGFYDLLQGWIREAESQGRPLYILEAGCGVGNTIFPILGWNNSIRFYACDISKEAIGLLQVCSPRIYFCYYLRVLHRIIQPLIVSVSIVLYLTFPRNL